MTLPLATPEFTDDFAGAAANLTGRTSPSGHVWGDPNNRFAVDGAGLLIAQDYTTSGRYADVTLAGDTCYGMSATGIWTGTSTTITDNSGIVLISGASGARPGGAGTSGIFNDCIHPVFGDWQINVDLWVGGASEATPHLVFAYPGGVVPRDVPHTFGWELTGIILSFYMPLAVGAPESQRVIKRIADPRYPAWIGKHLITQIYNTGHTANQPKIDSVQATSKPIPGYIAGYPLPAALSSNAFD